MPLHHTKNGVPAAFWRLMKSIAAATVSSSTVSIRFFVSGPVSSIRPSAKLWITPRGPNRSRKVRPSAVTMSAG